MDTDEIIATLNELIETSRDGEVGFRSRADGVKNAQLKQMFEPAADRCRQAVGELQAKYVAWAATRSRVALFHVRRTAVGSTSNRR